MAYTYSEAYCVLSPSIHRQWRPSSPRSGHGDLDVATYLSRVGFCFSRSMLFLAALLPGGLTGRVADALDAGTLDGVVSTRGLGGTLSV